MKRVFVASPYAGHIQRNEIYARAAMRDALSRGEAPLAPHLLYTQVLPEDGGFCRNLGIDAGKAFLAVCEVMAVYEDFGVSSGMKGEIEFAEEIGVPVERRSISEYGSPYPVIQCPGFVILSNGISDDGSEGSYGNLDGASFRAGDVIDMWTGVWAPSEHPDAGIAICDWPPVRFGEK